MIHDVVSYSNKTCHTFLGGLFPTSISWRCNWTWHVIWFVFMNEPCSCSRALVKLLQNKSVWVDNRSFQWLCLDFSVSPLCTYNDIITYVKITQKPGNRQYFLHLGGNILTALNAWRDYLTLVINFHFKFAWKDADTQHADSRCSIWLNTV